MAVYIENALLGLGRAKTHFNDLYASKEIN